MREVINKTTSYVCDGCNTAYGFSPQAMSCELGHTCDHTSLGEPKIEMFQSGLITKKCSFCHKEVGRAIYVWDHAEAIYNFLEEKLK